MGANIRNIEPERIMSTYLTSNVTSRLSQCKPKCNYSLSVYGDVAIVLLTMTASICSYARLVKYRKKIRSPVEYTLGLNVLIMDCVRAL